MPFLNLFRSKSPRTESVRGALLPGSNLAAALLEKDDLPGGWSTIISKDPFKKGDEDAMRPCGQSVPFMVASTEVAVRSFERSEDGPFVGCEVMRYAPGIAGQLLTTWDHALRTCGRWSQTTGDAGVQAQFTATPLAFPPLGEQSTAWQLVMDAVVDGVPGRQVIEETYVRLGDSLMRVTVMGDVPDPDLALRLTQLGAGKLASLAA